MAQVGEAWSVLSVLPPVKVVVAAVQPKLEYTWQQYLAAHDAVVAAPMYCKCAPAQCAGRCCDIA